MPTPLRRLTHERGDSLVQRARCGYINLVGVVVARHDDQIDENEGPDFTC